MSLRKFSPLMTGLFAWITAVYFGLILMDMTYFRFLNTSLDSAEITALTSKISDVLLWIAFLMILAAIGAVLFSWNTSTARYLFIASLSIIIFGLFVPVFFNPLFQNPQNLKFGPWLRIIINGLASSLAFAGMSADYQQK